MWGVVTGAISGVVVLDFDGDIGGDTLRALGLSPHRMSGSGGYHVVYRHPGVPIKTATKSDKDMSARWPGMDVRADGGFCVITGGYVRDGRRLEYIELRDPTPHAWEAMPADLAAFLIDRGAVHHGAPQTAGQTDNDNMLRDIAPAIYLRELLGVQVNRSGKALCPLHDDRDTPSLHAYPTGERGWCCYGCGRGGSIYDAAAYAWGYPMPLHGAAFLQVDEELWGLPWVTAALIGGAA
jgi:hypothetical protein